MIGNRTMEVETSKKFGLRKKYVDVFVVLKNKNKLLVVFR